MLRLGVDTVSDVELDDKVGRRTDGEALPVAFVDQRVAECRHQAKTAGTSAITVSIPFHGRGFRELLPAPSADDGRFFRAPAVGSGEVCFATLVQEHAEQSAFPRRSLDVLSGKRTAPIRL